MTGVVSSRASVFLLTWRRRELDLVRLHGIDWRDGQVRPEWGDVYPSEFLVRHDDPFELVVAFVLEFWEYFNGVADFEHDFSFVGTLADSRLEVCLVRPMIFHFGIQLGSNLFKHDVPCCSSSLRG